MPIKKWLKYALSNYILQCTLRTISSAQGVKKAMIPRIKDVPDMGPSINYVVSVGGGGSPKDDLLHRPYLTKKTTRGEGVRNRQF